jgi:hypothetical protein
MLGVTYDLSGTPLPRAPEWTANADAQYSFAMRNNLEGFVRGEFSYRAEAIPLFDPTFGFSGVMIRPSQRIYGIRFQMHTQ